MYIVVISTEYTLAFKLRNKYHSVKVSNKGEQQKRKGDFRNQTEMG